MADKTLSQLRSENPPSSVDGDELLYAVQGGDDTALTVSEIRGTSGGGGAGGTTPITPSELLFVKQATVEFFEVTPANLLDFTEPFDSDSGQFTRYTEGTQATFTVSGGQATISNTSGAARNDIIVEGDDLVIPQAGCSIDVVSRSGALGAYSNVGVGIVKDANNFIVAGYDAAGGFMWIQEKIGGTKNYRANAARTLTPPYTLGFSLVGNTACAYVDEGGGWEFVTSYEISTGLINFKTTSLTGWKRGFNVITPNNHTYVFDNFLGGYFGGVGIRDINPITSYEGAPLITGDTIRAVCTFSDGAGNGFQGTADIDVVAHTIDMVGVQFIERDGAKQDDLAGQIITDGASYKLFISTWGNGFGGDLDMLYGDFPATEITVGARLLTGMTTLTLPTQAAGYGVYDPSVFLDGATWRLAHSVTTDTSFAGDPFYTAVCESTDLSTWTNPFDDRSTTKFEGTRIVKFEDDVYIMSGTTNRFRCYDKFVNYRDDIKATVDGGTVTQPHPSIFKHGNDYYLVTFDQEKHPSVSAAFTWGRMVIHKAPYTV